ncbi:hypothetical protein FGU65_08450 [Methanoculleus sp. FWC-SCC1]|uniref:Uncharacterized protein n=1 Tax=Methanoculleus frigidifontis TaxID=2584085 RepID=A0ABT8MAK0_9EURY|nr:hypothetical protein [Methanoculleus sp. FWC-SCC1]MDN7024916.1 hypothetical protein [Methanoculleus sp. FWC-SCC1]
MPDYPVEDGVGDERGHDPVHRRNAGTECGDRRPDDIRADTCRVLPGIYRQEERRNERPKQGGGSAPPCPEEIASPATETVCGNAIGQPAIAPRPPASSMATLIP